MQVPRGRPVRPLPLVALIVSLAAPGAFAQRPSPDAAAEPSAAAQGSNTISGIVTTQNGSIPLGGALVSLMARGGKVASYTSDADGAFRFEHLVPGSYTI